MRAIFLLAVFALLSTSSANPALAHEKVKGLYAFDGQSGDYPDGGVIVDPHGTIFGTTSFGGNGRCNGGAGCGTVFSLSPPMAGSNSWTFDVLYEFQGGQDGNSPQAQLTLGPNGSIYGYSTGGSPGTVWQLSPPSGGRTAWTFQILYIFSGDLGGDLAGIYSPLLLDGVSLYGIARGGPHNCGQFGCGLVFRLKPSGGTWKEKTLFEFSGGASGAFPSSIVGPDSSRSLYVSTTDGNGAVYAVSPAGYGTWSETMLTSFAGGNDGAAPSNLVLATDGSLYGIAYANRGGLAFQLVNTGSDWMRTNIANIDHRYYGPNSLAPGPNGTLVGVIWGDVDFFPGAVFELAPPTDGGSWTYTELASFTHGPDRNPVNVVTGRGGHLYGVLNGGDSGFGALFKVR